MDKFSINPKDIIFSLDIGTRSVIGAVGIVKDKKFNVIAEEYIEHEERAMIDGQIHDINIVANEVKIIKERLEKKLNITLNNVSIAAAGRFLKTISAKSEMTIDNDIKIDKEIVRSLELTAVKKAEEEINKKMSGKLYCVGYSVKNYYLNGYIISNLISHSGENIAVEVISTFLPRTVVDSLYSVMEKASLNVESLTLEPIAAMEAVVPQKFRLLNIALVDIGAGTSDIAISSNETIASYGMVPLAGDEITEVIAKNYLVDFNTAEEIKKACTKEEKIKYKDVLGLENEIDSSEVKKIIYPIVDKIIKEISKTIISLNGEKAPNAVFLVGGGSYTPNIKEIMAKYLNLPENRIAIKNRKDIENCICEEENYILSSIGVTVIGIGLISIKKSGHDFIDVTLNDKVISLFNSHKHTIKDVMLQGGINPKLLIGRNGKNIRFNLNGVKRVAFGTMAKNASIVINEKQASIDSEVREGDNIKINFAENGYDANPEVFQFIKNIDSKSFYLNDIVQIVEPIAFINDERVKMDSKIDENDDVKVINPKTLGDYIKYYENKKTNVEYIKNNEYLSMDYIIKDGDRIYTREVEETCEVNDKENNYENIESIDNAKESLYNHNEIKSSEDIKKELIYKTDIEEETISDIKKNLNENYNKENLKEINTKMILNVNGNKVILQDKKEYVFINIFDYIDFDLSIPKGNLMLLLNGNKAGYYDKLKDGDEIIIKWE